MTVLRSIEPLQPEGVLFGYERRFPSVTPRQAERYCREAGLLGFWVNDKGHAVGYAVARSHPKILLVASLEGRISACKLLLKRLMRLAGERDVCVWCPQSHRRLRRLLRKAGFRFIYADTWHGKPARLYYWNAFA